jgi:hypothetical protein
MGKGRAGLRMTPTSALPVTVEIRAHLYAIFLTYLLRQKMSFRCTTKNQPHSRTNFVFYVSFQDQQARHDVCAIDFDDQWNNTLFPCLLMDCTV